MWSIFSSQCLIKIFQNVLKQFWEDWVYVILRSVIVILFKSLIGYQLYASLEILSGDSKLFFLISIVQLSSNKKNFEDLFNWDNSEFQ